MRLIDAIIHAPEIIHQFGDFITFCNKVLDHIDRLLKNVDKLRQLVPAYISAFAMFVSSIHMCCNAYTLSLDLEMTGNVGNLDIYKEEFQCLYENNIKPFLRSIVRNLSDQANEMLPLETIQNLIYEFEKQCNKSVGILESVRKEAQNSLKFEKKASYIGGISVLLAAAAVVAYVYRPPRDETLGLSVASGIVSLSTAYISFYHFDVLKEKKQSVNTLLEQIKNCRETLENVITNLKLFDFKLNPNLHGVLEVARAWEGAQNAHDL